jgi:hypothetical protein
MTIEPIKQTENSTLKVLIGDDSFADQRTAKSALCLMLCGIATVNDTYCVEGNFVNDKDYVVSEFPDKKFSGAEIRVVSTVEDMIKESTGNYDWIITDMNYGHGQETGGKTVLAHSDVKKNPAVKAIFTSEDDPKILKALSQMGADIVVAPSLSKTYEHKTELLGKAIGEYYQTKN